MLRLSLALASCLTAVTAKVSYDGYKVLRVTAHDDLSEIESALHKIDTIVLESEDDHATISVAVSPDAMDAFEGLGLESEVLSENLAADLELEGPFIPYEGTVKTNGLAAADLPPLSYFESYHSYEEHLQFITDIQAAFPDNSEIFTIGESVEGRELTGIHLWGKDGKGANPGIIWHGTVHAREWIVAPTVEYLTYKIVEDYQSGEALITETLDSHDFYVIPIVNPDGFIFTNTDNRLWRKNRQERSGQTCVGTDINRNWPNKWDVPGGSSPSPCSETYRGLEPGDTPENQALANHTLAVAESTGVKSYIDWHSYGKYILLPYGYSCSLEIPELDSQLEVAGGVAAAIKEVDGLDFTYGPTCSTLYQTAGGSNDWAYDVAGVEYSWVIELRLTAREGGFVIPPTNILPSGEENWAGMKYLFSQF
jgi:carboxypeptidase A4